MSARELADEAYARFLDRREAGEDVSLEAFAAELQPDVASEVLRLAELCEAAERQLAAAGPRALEPPRAGRYDVLHEIGRGGMGSVYAAWDSELERPVAMKVLSRRDAKLARRFVAEAKLTGGLDHPGIVAVHELGADGDRAWFTMAEVRGETFARLIDETRSGEGGWSVPRAVGVLLRVCEAVAFAHSRGIVHRDLKPHNVMVGSFGETYVMDWGLARRIGAPDELADVGEQAPDDPQLTRVGDVVGTPAYMSPEQARGEREAVGTSSDVYALGAMLYHLLVGHAPHLDAGLDSSPRAVIARAATGDVTPIAELEPKAPPELVAVAERAMHTDPAQRYPGVVELGDDLRAWLEGRVVRAYESGGWAELKKWVGRNRRLAAALAGMVAVAIAGTAATFYAQGAERARSLRFLDLQLVREARDEARYGLWPEVPAMASRMEAWIGRAEDLVARLPVHAAELARLDSRAEAGAELPRFDAGRDVGRYTFRDPDERWRHERLSELVAELEAFAGPQGEVARVRDSLDWAKRVRDETVVAYADAWAEAAERVGADVRFAGLELEPQLGLVPLGPDPRSGLEEFAFVRSGSVPARGAGGELAYELDAAAVLVLLPGGTYRMGREPHDDAISQEWPPHDVVLSPFFMGKHELTQAQWRALGGAESAYFAAADGADRLPMESVTWFECAELMGHHGLALPTEAQWEYAATNGRATEFHWGDDTQQVFERAHLSGQRPLPVGSLSANDFGLYDLLGNVSEWCLDVAGGYELPVRGPAQVRVAPPSTKDVRRTMRGAGFFVDSGGLVDSDIQKRLARPRTRVMPEAGERSKTNGLRVVRMLD